MHLVYLLQLDVVAMLESRLHIWPHAGSIYTRLGSPFAREGMKLHLESQDMELQADYRTTICLDILAES